MKLHRLGKNVHPYMEYLTEVRTENRDGYTYQYSSLPRIAEGNLLLHIQQWFRLPFGQTVRLPTDRRLYVCPHWITNEPNGLTELSRMVTCATGHWKYSQDNCGFCSGNWGCKLCATEFQIDIKKLWDGGVAIIVTRWSDLGEGRTPEDDKWTMHVKLDTPYRFRTYDGCIAEAFEGQTFSNKQSILSPPDEEQLLRDDPQIKQSMVCPSYSKEEEKLMKTWKRTDPMSEYKDIVLQPGQIMPDEGPGKPYAIRILPGGRKPTKLQP
jgi:hypothetical protein